MKTLLAFLLTVTLLPAVAEEVIQDFSSHIEIKKDSDIVVTETIRVQAEGINIQHGIFRDFPTLYSGPLGLRSTVSFELLEVLRDGKPEPWHTETRSNGLRIYIGSKDVFVPPGETTYTIKYRTGRQLGFFKDFDELYWNVTGNGWKFPILHASACVELPPGAKVGSIEAYTGPQGSKRSDYKTVGHSGCDASMVTTAPLSPGEGLTIVVTWPKGFVEEPSPSAGIQAVVGSNAGLIAGILGIVLVFGYFLISWILFGRDPESGIIVPLFEPPEGFTPQDVRYLNGLGTCDQTGFAAAVLHLAVQKDISIRQAGKKSYSLVKENSRSSDPEQTHLIETLFKSGSFLSLEQRNHATLQAAQSVLAKDLAKKIGPYFARNTRIWVAGLLATLIPLGLSLANAPEKGGAVFMMLWLSIWSVGCAALSMTAFKAWKSSNKLNAIPLTLVSIPFLGGWVFGITALIKAASPWVCILYVAGITLCILFQHLLKRPTPEGQRLRDRIQGFKKYLSVAEAERLGLENPPERTPELFEKFLPYALALGVEQAWSEQFSDILAAASSQDLQSGTRPRPFVLPLATASFTDSFSSAISSASTAPGSSSGSGGGGSSGGGGGGGGGGGW